jgi:peptide/nickel transport system permease protein
VGQYILRRLLLMIPVALHVSVTVFALNHLSPGDPIAIFAGGEVQDPEIIAAVRKQYGLDQPLPVQYVVWVEHALQGDFGRSLRTRQPVLEAITERLPKTLELGGAALLLSIVIALIVGTIAAVRRNSLVDLVASGVTIAGVSLPNFYLGIILILVFGLVFRVFPPGGYSDFASDPFENLKRLVLPAITLASASTALNLRQVRSSLLDVLSQDYLRTARAKGLRERTVVLRHAWKNALIPVVTIFGLQVGAILEGAIITETIFFWPGVGRLAVDSINGRDYPVVQGIVLLSALSYMASTLIVDILYAWLDPRISYRSRSA